MSSIEQFLTRLSRVVVDMERAMAGGPDFPDVPGGLDTPGLGVLLTIDLFGPQRPGLIAQILGLSSGGTSKLIERLHRSGLVIRRHDAVPGDRRAVVVEVTPRGRDTIRAFDQLLVELTPDLIVALRDIGAGRAAAPQPPEAAATGVPGPESVAGPALAALFLLVAEVDRAVVAVVGDEPLLQPADPRPLLVLLEAHQRGGVPTGELPELIGRSRAAAGRVVGQLRQARLVTRRVGGPGGDRRMAELRLTPKGRTLVTAIVDAQVAALPIMLPPMEALLRELVARSTA